MTRSLAHRWQLGFSHAEWPEAMAELDPLLAGTLPTDRDVTARRFMAEWNRRLAYKAAQDFARRVKLPRWGDFDDLTGEALASLVRCSIRFDPSLGWRFSTYAVSAIQNDLSRWHEKHLRRGLSFCPQAGPLPAVLGWVPDRGREDVEDDSEDRERLQHLLAALPSRLRRVILARYGLKGEAKTLAQLAEELKLSKEGVRFIQKKALKHLQESAGVTP
jgi:RNA polymerase sigma factor (sigma-70 family)